MPRFSNLTRSTTLRVAGAVAALAVAVPVTGTFAAERPVVELACDAPKRSGSAIWEELRATGFNIPEGVVVPNEQDVKAFAVESKPLKGRRNMVVITNGNSIEVSPDGGCRFDESLVLERVPDPSLRLSGLTTTIVDVYIAQNGVIYATAEELETGATVGRPHVLISTDRGKSWFLGDTGLPPIGHPLRLRAANAPAANVVYLSFSQAKEQGTVTCPPAPLPCPDPGGDAEPAGLLWGSTDGGRTWSARTDPADLDGAEAIRYFSIEDDVSDGSTLYVAAAGKLQRSTDGGRTFAEPQGLTQSSRSKFTAVETIDKGDNPKNPLKVLAFTTTGEMYRYDTKLDWVKSKVPFGAVQSVAQRPEGDIAVATSPNGPGGVSMWRIYPNDFFDYTGKDQTRRGRRYAGTGGWESINAGTSIGVAANIAGGGSGRGSEAGTYYVRDKQRLLRFLRPVQVPGRPPLDAELVDPPERRLGKITPADLEIDIPLGKTQDVDYKLTLPPSPSPLDLFLLVDNSGSMQYLIEDLKESLGDVAKALVASGVDVRVGVGRINVQPDTTRLPIDDPGTPEDESKARPLYERLREIGPVDDELFEQLNLIDGYGGSGDEAQLESLLNAVTGQGQDPAGLGALIGYQIPPGEDAKFRENSAVHVIVHATDEPFSRNIRNGTTFDEVARVLKKARVKQIGLSTDPMGKSIAHQNLSEMAVATEATAPAGGVDCDGNGRADILKGGPLVCGQSEGLDKTLINVLHSLSDRATITLSAKQGATLAKVSRVSFGINAKKETNETFRITYSCADVLPGQYIHNLEAGLRGVSVAKATATINCGGVTIPRSPAARANVPPGGQPGEPGSNPPVTQVNAPLPVPAPVQPITQPQVQTQTQAQSQANPQAGAADQEQEQIQVATAANTLEGGRQEDDQLAMSALDYSRTAPAPYYVLLTGIGMAAATGVALRRRTRTQLARQRIR